MFLTYQSFQLKNALIGGYIMFNCDFNAEMIRLFYCCCFRSSRMQSNLPFVISLTQPMLFVTLPFLHCGLTSVWTRGGSRLHRRVGRSVRPGGTGPASGISPSPTPVLTFPVSSATSKNKIMKKIMKYIQSIQSFVFKFNKRKINVLIKQDKCIPFF